MLPLLLSLGFWQLQRAEEKRQLQQAFEQQQAQPPVAINDLAPAQIAKLPNYSRISLEGAFDAAHSWLLDNKLRHGRVGYEVITPFVLQGGPADGTTLLVNRGWIAGDLRRDRLPTIPPTAVALTLFASVFQPADNRMLESRAETDSWPRVIAELTPQVASHSLEREVHSIQARLAPDSPAALMTEWRTINTRPEKHTAYAVQWFAMAVALVVWFACASSNVITIIKHALRRGQNRETPYEQ